MFVPSARRERQERRARCSESLARRFLPCRTVPPCALLRGSRWRPARHRGALRPSPRQHGQDPRAQRRRCAGLPRVLHVLYAEACLVRLLDRRPYSSVFRSRSRAHRSLLRCWRSAGRGDSLGERIQGSELCVCLGLGRLAEREAACPRACPRARARAR